MNKRSLQTKAYSVHKDAPRFESLGASVSLRAGTDQTGGAFNLFDVVCPAGYETPLHIHYAEDVAIYVLEGALDIHWGSEKQPAGPGCFLFQPRATPHGFRVTGQQPARILYMTFPGGFDAFVVERSKANAVAEARYGIEILGSLPA